MGNLGIGKRVLGYKKLKALKKHQMEFIEIYIFFSKEYIKKMKGGKPKTGKKILMTYT